MAREPELSIKVKVDPQINPSSLKTNIERQVKQSGEKPQVEIDPNVDGIKGKIEDKLKNVKATATVTPIVDIERIKTDIQNQINSIGDMPKVTVGVDINNFSNELSEQLKNQLKEVNQQLSYYLKNLTKNTNSLGSFTEDIFNIKGIAPVAQKAAKEASSDFANKFDKSFNINSLFDKTKKTTLKEVKNLTDEISKSLYNLQYGKEYWDGKSLITDKYNKDFDELQIRAKKLDTIIQSFGGALNSKDKNITSVLDEFSKNGLNLNTKTGDFLSIEQFLDSILSFDEKFKNADSIETFFDSLDDALSNLVGDDSETTIYDIFNSALGELENIQTKFSEISANTKAVTSELKGAQKEFSKVKSDDQSGHLDDSTIEAYGNAIDKVLSNIAQKQEDINVKRRLAVELEKNILSNTTLTREGLSRELEEYTKVLNKFDTEKITKLAAILKETRVTVAERPTQAEQTPSIQPPVQQKKKKESVQLAGGGIPDFNEGLKSNKKNEETTVPVKGKVTITDADIAVDVKNPVKIPGVAVIDTSAAQVGNTGDLKSSADALASANKSLHGIASKTEGYASNISALGPAFQYVAQEVDNLSRSFENQILDFNRISEQTNAYIGKTGSISIDTSNVAVTGEPAAIDGKVILGAEDIVPPETPVDIKGHVELKTTDITPPSEPVELQGKISKTTMESAAKGKKKKGQDVEKPDVVELTGHVKLEDKDIERPNPVKLNGKVVVTKDNIKLPEGGIDVKGNLILKNAEIANAIKETAGKESSEKNSTKSKKDSTIIDTKAQQEANRLLQQEEQLQQRIADTKISGIKAVNKALDQNTSLMGKVRNNNGADKDWYSQLDEKQKKLEALRTEIVSSDDPVQVAKN